MNRKLVCCVVLLVILGACAAPTVAPTATLPPAPTITPTVSQYPTGTMTKTLKPTRTSRPTHTRTPTNTPWPTPPLPNECGTVVLGKPGTQSQDTTHPVLVQGVAILCTSLFLADDNFLRSIPMAEAMLDLDSGSPGWERADLEYAVSGRRYLFTFLGSFGKALDAPWSLNGLTREHAPEPTFEECKVLSRLFSNDNEPQYVCVITEEGHVSRIKNEQYDPVKAKDIYSLKISFITWDVVAPLITPTWPPPPRRLEDPTPWWSLIIPTP